MPLAYSYLRFSSPQQSTGDSLRRQIEARENWLAAHPGVVLDESLVMTDAGRSAFKRKEWDTYALARFVEKTVGSAAAQHVADLRNHFQTRHPPDFVKDPLGDYAFLVGTKARTLLVPPALAAAGIELHYTRFHEIAEVMLPDEIHPEVKEKLDLIQKAFRL